ncbi:MAG: hypothetical protein AB8B63_13835 [Granulosicoccus sp.]
MTEPISTQPLDSGDLVLLDKFHEDIARQSERMDDLAKHLITVELAVSGLYATVLKLVGDKGQVLLAGPFLWITFLFWLIALALSLIALFPRQYDVDTNVLDGHNRRSGATGVTDYFHKSARYKRRLLIFSSLFFYLGIIVIVLSMS